MNKLYVVAPSVLLSAFLVYERDFERKRDAEEEIRKVEIAAARRLADEALARHEQAAAAELRARTEERERQDRERAARKQRDYENQMMTLRAQADQQVADAQKLDAELAFLSSQLAEARAKQNATERATFELARKVELQRVDRRNAEMETFRAAAVVAHQLGLETPVILPARQPEEQSGRRGW